MNKVILLIAILSLGTLGWAGSAREDATDRLDNAKTVMHEIMGAPRQRNSGRSTRACKVHSCSAQYGQRRFCLRRQRG